MYSNCCLLIVDVQNGFINEHTRHLPGAIAQFIQTHSFGSVIATAYCNTPSNACFRLGGWTDCMENTPSAELVPEIKPYVSRIFKKHTFSGLTSLMREYLADNNFEKIYICGVNTDCCVLATAFSLYDNLIDCCVIEDLCASTLGEQKHNAAIQLLKDNITELRIVRSTELSGSF